MDQKYADGKNNIVIAGKIFGPKLAVEPVECTICSTAALIFTNKSSKSSISPFEEEKIILEIVAFPQMLKLGFRVR